MRVLIRTDGGKSIGSGHVGRCLVLAMALRQRGAVCHFAMRALPGHLGERVAAEGFGFDLLAEPAAGGWSAEADAQATQALAADFDPSLVIVDHYGLDARWEAVVGGERELLAIDDLADRPHACDLLLDQNHHSDAKGRYVGLIPADAATFLGPEYALMHPAFAVAREMVRPADRPVERVFIFYGGTDASNETARALAVLARPELRHLAVNVVVGRNHPDPDGLARLAAWHGNAVMYSERPHLADLLVRADLAFGAGGATTWERCALGVPSVVTTVAGNQEPGIQALSAAGIVQYAGAAGQLCEDGLHASVRALLDSPGRLEAMRQAALAMTDGGGAKKLACRLIPEQTPLACESVQEAAP
jgi:UDP-2,4-diacetamido-2,4,6-trideoxy-beta-L-altropyranose hydrolase